MKIQLKEAIKKIIKHTFLYKIYLDVQNIHLKKLSHFIKSKRKQRTIRHYGKKFGIDTLIETGTYLGNTVEGLKSSFKKIISIELDKNLYERAKQKFSSYKHITIVQGDSGKVIPEILANTNYKCLFWLDAHDYSKEENRFIQTPIREELSHILSHSLIKNLDHVILIDDARLFTGQGDCSTLEEIRNFVFKTYPDWIFEIKNDIIRIHKRK
ncbi:MAG: rRNA adenine N-6-methyltransferase family protein [Patescibacteria group bacterium]|nr:rRNA adenine N-6-methyltransferase family protein [Patescibacteria group bacterium]